MVVSDPLGVILEDGAQVVGAALIGGAVEVAVRALYQAAVGDIPAAELIERRAMRPVEFILKTVPPPQATKRRGAVKVAIRALNQAGIGSGAIVAAKAMQQG